MDDQIVQLFAVLAVAVGLYAKAFGQYQFQIAEWIIAARQVESRYKGLVNLAVGVVLAGCFAALAAWKLGDWSILAVGLLAGVLASVEAAKVHDGQVPAEAEKPVPKYLPMEAFKK